MLLPINAFYDRYLRARFEHGPNRPNHGHTKKLASIACELQYKTLESLKPEHALHALLLALEKGWLFFQAALLRAALMQKLVVVV